jgi:hypothetical protein
VPDARETPLSAARAKDAPPAAAGGDSGSGSVGPPSRRLMPPLLSHLSRSATTSCGVARSHKARVCTRRSRSDCGQKMPKPVDLSVLGLRPRKDLSRTRSLSTRVRTSRSLALLQRCPCRTSNRRRHDAVAWAPCVACVYGQSYPVCAARDCRKLSACWRRLSSSFLLSFVYVGRYGSSEPVR